MSGRYVTRPYIVIENVSVSNALAVQAIPEQRDEIYMRLKFLL
jgi:hypothetical protein